MQTKREETLQVLGSSLLVTGDSAVGGRGVIFSQHELTAPLTGTALRCDTCSGLASSCGRDRRALVCKRMKRQFSMKHFSWEILICQERSALKNLKFQNE